MAKVFLLLILFGIWDISFALSEEEEQEKWYQYNSMFIRYGYRMTDRGKINKYELWNKMLVQQNIEDYMQGRGIFFHPSVFWEEKGSISPNIKFMFSKEQPPNETLFEYAKKELEENSCITLTKIEETTTKNCHAKGQASYICVYGEAGTCAAEYGQNLTKPTLFSVTSNCGKRGVLHEMGHVLGLQHSQARTDRGKDLSISFKNIGYANDDVFRKAILSDHQICAKTPQETQKMPFDFASVMNTGILDWSENYQLILVPTDPRHLYVIDYARDFFPHFSHYDLWFINTKYKCDKKFGPKCSNKKCENFGYLAKNCTCMCPKGTHGSTCSRKSSSTDVYNIPETPACYRKVTAEDDSFTLSGTGLVKAKEAPFTQHCVIVITSPHCKLPFLTIDTRIAIQGLKPKVRWWFDNDAMSCSHFSLFYNVSGMHTRNICWDQLFDIPVYWIFSRQTSMWLFARMKDQELTDIGGHIKMYIHTTGDYRCKLGNNDIFDAVNTGRMRSVGGTAQSATAMAIILPAVAVCALLILAFVYWKFIRKPAGAAEADDGADKGDGA